MSTIIMSTAYHASSYLSHGFSTAIRSTASVMNGSVAPIYIGSVPVAANKRDNVAKSEVIR